MDYANARTVAGGVAGVIIPLPASLRTRTGLLPFKFPSGRPFAVSDDGDGDGYGFARLGNGTCPNDLGDSSSPYRNENGDLRSTKRGGDACMVIYIVDGGPNDEDGEVNRAVLDPLGLRGAASGSGGSGGGSAIGYTMLLILVGLLLLASFRRSKLPRFPHMRGDVK